MENTNEMTIIFDSYSSNEAFARVAVAAFMTSLNPTVEEVADVKTAVSEAVTNAIIHGYESRIEKITLRCKTCGDTLYIEIEDHGKGMEDVKKAMEPLFTTRPELDRSGDGIFFYGSFHGSGRSKFKAGKRNYCENAENNWKRTKGMDHTIALIQKSHEGDEEARAQIVEENTGLVWCIVRRFTGRGTELEDLFQIGTIGLLKAIDKFDLSYEVKFSTYAVPMISGEIKRFLRDDGMIKVSRSLKELSYKGYQAQEVLGRKLGREPSVTELAEYLDVSPEELTMAMDACTDVESLHRPVYKKEGQEISLMEKVGKEDGAEERVLDHLLLKELLTSLDKEERKLIYLRYFAEKTQTQIGKEMGISQVQVSRMEKKILKNLRERI